VHFLREESKQYQQSAFPISAEALVELRKAIEADGKFKKIALGPTVPDRAICLGIVTSTEEQA
jgi:hypothetical protein